MQDPYLKEIASKDPFPAMDLISGQMISLTNPIQKILGQFVNKPGIRLFWNRALLIRLSHACFVWNNVLFHVLLSIFSTDVLITSESNH